MSDAPASQVTPDSEHKGLVALLPPRLRDFALLARFDRPIGWWLLFWPCAWGVWLTGAGWQILLVLWLLLGAIAMRGAGCVYNDIVDADLDRQVERTAQRPVASGRVSLRAAWIWLLVLCAIGLFVLFQLRLEAQIVALASLVLVAIYPFMKRITWWPQAWLGLVFTWGAPVGWVALRGDRLDVMAALYAGSVCWCVGYDTIYALQDREDDALVGIRSSALRLDKRVREGVAGFYAGGIGFWGLAFWQLRQDWVALFALLPAALHLAWQTATLEPRARIAGRGGVFRGGQRLMCNLYRMTRTADEIAHLFDVKLVAEGGNVGGDTYPGEPGLVVAEGELRQMHWGFPLSLHGKQGQRLKPKPVNNARTDKLEGPFWHASFVKRRCLIPMTGYAEAEGKKGHKTRSWLAMPEGEPFAAAGLWRYSDEWGEVYSMIVTDAAGAAAEVHTRMPVIIPQDEWRTFLEAEPKRAYALCHPYEGELALDRTRQLWGGGWAD